MKRKIIITFLCLTMGLSIVACGNKASTTPSTEKATATESVTENTAVTKYASAVGNTNTSSTDKKDNKDDKDNKSDATTSSVPESESWPEYKETMDYYINKGLADESAVHMLNPDIYGTETAGKATYEYNFSYIDASVDIRRLMVKTTKGFEIEAWYYVDTNSVQFVYTGEVSPAGSWFTDEASIDTLINAANSKYGSANFLNLTHQDKIDALGTPTMTDDEVVAAIKTKYGM